MQKFNILVALLLLGSFRALAVPSCAQPGKDGVASNLSGVINTYYGGSGTATNATVTLGALNPDGAQTPIAAGDLILIVQMQDGSSTDFVSNTPALPAPGGTYGTGTSPTAGLYEYASVQSVSGTTLTLSTALLQTYVQDSATARSFQVVRVPQYSSATITGVLKAAPWSNAGGTLAPSGGIVALDVAGQTQLNSSIDVTGQGFRGGAGLNGTGNRTTGTPLDQRYPYQSNVYGGSKGEGTAGTPDYVFAGTVTPYNNTFGLYPNGTFGQGAPGSAGGGGNDGAPTTGNNQYNSGGGGGANAGIGGLGGKNWDGGSASVETGGRGGNATSPSATRVFLGGGGGAGTSNNNAGTNAVTAGLPSDGPLTSGGASGGGMVFLRTGALAVSGGQIKADGNRGTTVSGTSSSEAAGGGGGGGSVFVSVATGTPTVAISAQGGAGGNANYYRHGPGGGGGGGLVVRSAAVSGSVTVSGGVHGVDSSTGKAGHIPDAYGSTSGDGGSSVFSTSPLTGVPPSANCLPVLTVTKTTTTPTRFTSSTSAAYTITVANGANTASAESVKIADTGLPPNFTFASGTVSLQGGATRTNLTDPVASSTTPTWGDFTLPAGSSVSLNFTTTLTSPAIGAYRNGAALTYLDPARTTTTGTATLSSDQMGSTADRVTVYGLPNVSLQKFVREVTPTSTFGTTATGRPTTVLEYCLTYANTGGYAANNFVLSDPIPANSTVKLAHYGTALRDIALFPNVQLMAGSTRPDPDTGSSYTPAEASLSQATGLSFATTLAAGAVGTICFQTTVN